MKFLTLVVLLVAFFSVAVFVSGLTIEPRLGGSCDYVQEATDYRNATNFSGIYGRFSDSGIRCFVPGNNHKSLVRPGLVGSVGVPEFSFGTLFLAVFGSVFGIFLLRKR